MNRIRNDFDFERNIELKMCFRRIHCKKHSRSDICECFKGNLNSFKKCCVTFKRTINNLLFKACTCYGFRIYRIRFYAGYRMECISISVFNFHRIDIVLKKVLKSLSYNLLYYSLFSSKYIKLN